MNYTKQYALLGFVDSPYFVISSKGLILFTNTLFSEITGFNETDCYKKTIKLLFKNGLPDNKNDIVKALKEKKSWTGSLLITHKNGDLIKVQCKAIQFVSSAADEHYICSLTQTTPAVVYHEKINELKVLFRSLFQKTSDILFLFINDGNALPLPFFDVNKTACEVLGYSRNDLLSLSILDITASESRADIINLQETLGKKAVHFMELILVKKNKQKVHIIFESLFVNLDGNKIILLIGKNISEQKELQHKLSQIEKLEAVGQLAGGIAHDFNNVLAGISGLAELSLRKLPGNHKAVPSIKTIYQKANNSANMVRQLVAFSRKQKLSTRAIDLNKAIKANYKLLERYLGEDINFKAVLGKSSSIIKADSASLDQILTNLCINARDAMPDGGDLTIKTKNIIIKNDRMTASGKIIPGKYVLFSVHDSGIGMSSDTIRHIFEPFFTTKDIGYGTGLGLSIVYGLIKQHDGYIECFSEIGMGTRFDIYFPLLAEKESASEGRANQKSLAGHETILIVEDEADLILYLKESLELFGYNTLIAHNGAKALEVFEQNIEQIDMIITDVVMPEMGGIELKLVIENIKPSLKFLLISAYTNRIEPGVPFLPKPFQTEELALAVRNILDETYVFDE